MQTYLFFKRIAIKLYIIYLVVDNKIYERDSKNIKVTFSVILSNFFAPVSQILEGFKRTEPKIPLTTEEKNF